MTINHFNRQGTHGGYHTLEKQILPNGDTAIVLIWNKDKK